MDSSHAVLVTGSSRGIGRQIAIDLVKRGYIVYGTYNSSKENAQELTQTGIHMEKADVSKREDLARVREKIEGEGITVSGLVNNAGIMKLMNFENYDETAFMEMLKINLMGTIYSTLEFLPHLKRTRGSIVNIASNAGIGTAAEGTTFYAITKSSVIILTKRLAFELGKYGIRVNAVAPGWIETDMTVTGKSQEEVERIKASFRSKTSLGITGKPSDISPLVVFLLSEDSRYMTGQTIVIDGGRIDNLTHGV
ncbi:3-ketoacyl-ACP reductase [Sulfolobales archaeon HS-7]|nr:3-ketoacyl-ACP reductase [Sulfolobales archaeon HS-7]